jgi:hypothetical protein
MTPVGKQLDIFLRRCQRTVAARAARRRQVAGQFLAAAAQGQSMRRPPVIASTSPVTEDSRSRRASIAPSSRWLSVL